jgi:hypothetical protein
MPALRSGVWHRQSFLFVVLSMQEAGRCVRAVRGAGRPVVLWCSESAWLFMLQKLIGEEWK